MNRDVDQGADQGPGNAVRLHDIAGLVEQAHARARDIVLRELVADLVPAYRQAVAAHDAGVTPPQKAPQKAASGDATPTAAAPSSASPSQPPDDTTERAWYVYAVARHTDAVQVPALTGIDGEAVRVVPAGELAALASEVSMAGFRAAEQEPDLAPDGWLAQALRAHDAVVGQAFAAVPVLPFRFGALYPHRDAVVATMRSRDRDLIAEVDRLATAAEWEVRVYIDTANDTTDDAASEHATSAADTGDVGAGTAWMQRRRDAAVARETAEAGRARLVDEIGTQLATHARDSCPRAETASRDHNVPALDVVYLVDRTAQAAFLETVERLRRHWSAKHVRLDVTGPHPAYHFVRREPVRSGHG